MTAAPGAETTIDLVELPRLNLTFVRKADLDGRPQLYCNEHQGMFISSVRDPRVSAVTLSLLIVSLDGSDTGISFPSCWKVFLTVCFWRTTAVTWRSSCRRQCRHGRSLETWYGGGAAGTVLVTDPLQQAEQWSTEIIFDRRAPEWLESFEVRHYLYPVHLSRMFLFSATLASALYLLLMRILNKQYAEVRCGVAVWCGGLNRFLVTGVPVGRGVRV